MPEMPTAPLPIMAIGEPLLYADGAEGEMLRLLRTAEDRRSGSDELALLVRDWPTAYHLAPERAVLLDPLSIGSNDLVLDVGAGSGVNTRLCAERGAKVTAVEASAARAELIANRCAGLEGVEVLCGPLQELGDDRLGGYDLVLLVGVLEYASTPQGGSSGPTALLEMLTKYLAPNGVVVLAIENRLGLKYLLGFPEDHLGLPWVGWEGYRNGEPTTWSRRELTQMLCDVGLLAQKWLYPFPDYKLPMAVLAEEIYSHPDAVDMVDQLVGRPTNNEYAQSLLVADDRAAHRALLTAGLGLDVANSFLVVAGHSSSDVSKRVDENVLAWRVAPDRRRRWRQQAVVAKTKQDLVIKRRLVAKEAQIHSDKNSENEQNEYVQYEGWLGQVEVGEEVYVPGRNLEQELLAVAHQGSSDKIAQLLEQWRAVLAKHEIAVEAGFDPHPYLPADTTLVLPQDWLDVGPDNFVVTVDGLKFVDREWVAAGGVDVRLAVVRGLWKVVSAMLSARCYLLWPVTWSNDRLVMHLGNLIGEKIDMELLAQWRQAEAELIRLIYRQPEVRLAELYDAGSRSRLNLLQAPSAPYRRMEHLVQRQQEVIVDLQQKVTESEQIRSQLAHATATVAQNQQELLIAKQRLDRLAWRERFHNKIAKLIRRA